MKEIVYNCINNFSEIVAEGDYKGVHYICLNRGTHPCAYIVCDPLFLNKHKTEYGFLDCINVHGGVNYTGALKKLVGLSDREGVCFGWSYDTYSDWAGYWSEKENLATGQKKWTTQELILDCHSAIDQYLEAVKKDSALDPTPGLLLDKEILKSLGFKSTFDGMAGDDETSFQLIGNNDGNKWRVYIDLQTPSLTYARNQKPRRKYEGSILTLDELRMVIDLLDIPLTV